MSVYDRARFFAGSIGASRTARHRHSDYRKTPGTWREDERERIGIMGEIQFAQDMGIGIDPILDRRGGPVDFLVSGATVEVKTSLVQSGKPINLIIKCHADPVDYYVQYAYHADIDAAICLGFASRDVVDRCGRPFVSRLDVPSVLVPATMLRPLQELKVLMEGV